MPNPEQYQGKGSKKRFMKDCMHITKQEGKTQDQGLGQCLNMWRGKKALHEVIRFLATDLQAEKKWIQKAIPKTHEGKFEKWCKSNGFKDGVCQGCINKAVATGGHAQQMALFAVNVSKGKYSYPK